MQRVSEALLQMQHFSSGAFALFISEQSSLKVTLIKDGNSAVCHRRVERNQQLHPVIDFLKKLLKSAVGIFNIDEC